MSLTKNYKKDPTNAKKTVNSNKLLVGRYQCLYRILSESNQLIEPALYDTAL